MSAVLWFELRVAVAALRRAMRVRSRRLVWTIVSACAAGAIAFDVATSDVGSRDVGSWSPSPLAVCLAAVGVVVLGAFVGARTPSTYGTRGADRIWWRYAGIATRTGHRATTVILASRAMAFIAAGAVPLGVLFAIAAPDHAAVIVALASTMLVLAPLTVFVAAVARRSETAVGDVPRAITDSAPAPATPSRERGRVAIPRGWVAARWLVARRRGGAVVPSRALVVGAVLGFFAPRLAGAVGGQAASMAVVVGGFSIILDAALRGTTAPTALRSPWWRSAIGTSQRAMVAYACAEGLPFSLATIGAAIGLGAATGTLALGFAAIAALALAPIALRLLVLSVDVLFAASLDRRGAAAAVRLAVVGASTAAIVTLALAAHAYGGMLTSIAVLTVVLAGVVIVSARWCAWRLPYVGT